MLYFYLSSNEMYWIYPENVSKHIKKHDIQTTIFLVFVCACINYTKFIFQINYFSSRNFVENLEKHK